MVWFSAERCQQFWRWLKHKKNSSILRSTKTDTLTAMQHALLAIISESTNKSECLFLWPLCKQAQKIYQLQHNFLFDFLLWKTSNFGFEFAPSLLQCIALTVSGISAVWPRVQLVAIATELELAVVWWRDEVTGGEELRMHHQGFCLSLRNLDCDRKLAFWDLCVTHNCIHTHIYKHTHTHMNTYTHINTNTNGNSTLNKWSLRRGPLPTQHNKHNWLTSVPLAVFEPANAHKLTA